MSKDSTDLKVRQEAIQAELKKLLGVKSVMACPKITKVTLNMGLGQVEKKQLEVAVEHMELIAGQKPVVTRVRKSEANFKIREGWPIGVKVTLRKERMFRFLEHLLFVAMPAQREFNGLTKKSVDQQGNLSFGIPDHSVFRSIPFEKIQGRIGFDVTLTTSARDAESGFALLKMMGLPFKEDISGGKDGN